MILNNLIGKWKNRLLPNGTKVLQGANLDPTVKDSQNDAVQEEDPIQHIADLWLRECS